MKLQVSTPSDTEILATRYFDAPRALVWEAMSKPELLKRWLTGPPGWEMSECEDELKEGGTFKWVWSGPAGEKLTMTGVYREVTPPVRSSRTEKFEMAGMEMGEQLATVSLEEEGDRTKLTVHLAYATKEHRDGAVGSGMANGMEAGYAQLDEMLASGVIA